jgi:hypothetical protein
MISPTNGECHCMKNIHEKKSNNVLKWTKKWLYFFLKWVNSEVRLDYDKLKFNGLKNSWGPISLGLIQGNGLPFLRPA